MATNHNGLLLIKANLLGYYPAPRTILVKQEIKKRLSLVDTESSG